MSRQPSPPASAPAIGLADHRASTTNLPLWVRHRWSANRPTVGLGRQSPSMIASTPTLLRTRPNAPLAGRLRFRRDDSCCTAFCLGPCSSCTTATRMPHSEGASLDLDSVRRATPGIHSPPGRHARSSKWPQLREPPRRAGAGRLVPSSSRLDSTPIGGGAGPGSLRVVASPLGARCRPPPRPDRTRIGPGSARGL
jgi:hypothetical protein